MRSTPGPARTSGPSTEVGSYGIDTSTSPAVLPDGLVLWPGPDSSLWAVTPDGEVAWTLPLSGLVGSPAVTAGGAVLVGDSTRCRGRAATVRERAG